MPIATPSSVLVLRMAGVGDVLWTTPFLANLRHGLPDAHIAYVVRRGCAPVLENNPDVDELLVFESDRPGFQLGFIRRLRRRRFDCSIDLICTPGTAIQSLAAHAPVRVGFDFRMRKHAYTRRLDPHAANHGHSVEFHLYALEALGIPVVSRDLVWNCTPEERMEADALWTSLRLPSGVPVVALIPTGAFESKKWPVEHWQRLIAASAELPDAQFLIVWGSAIEREHACAIQQAQPQRATLLPPTTLRQLAALLERCTAAVGNDSGPLHIASAMRIPVLGLYGRTNAKSHGPWGSAGVTLQPPGQPDGVAGEDFVPAPMAGLQPATVIAALRRMLDAAE